MKRVFIMCALLAAGAAAKAQTSTDANRGPVSNDNIKVATVANEFANAGMAVKDGNITFSGLPAEKKHLYAVVTNADGETMRQQRITDAESKVDITKLHHGLYFVTLVYKSQSKKAFTLNL